MRGWFYWLARRDRPNDVPLVLRSRLSPIEPWETRFEVEFLVAVGRVEDGTRRVVQLIRPLDLCGTWMTSIWWEQGVSDPQGALVVEGEENFGPLTNEEAAAVRRRWPSIRAVVYTSANFPSKTSN